MSLRNTDEIDLIADNPSFDGIDLIAIDSDDEWDEIERYTLMLEKLTGYMAHIESGKIFENDSVVKGKDFRFWVICQTPANEAMLSIEAIKSRKDPSLRFPVYFASSTEEYFNGT